MPGPIPLFRLRKKGRFRLALPDLAGDAPATIVGAGGIPSAEAVGQPAVAAVVAAAGIASAEAVGAATVGATVAASGIASAEAVGAPAVSVGGGAGAASITGAGQIGSAEAVGQPTVVLVPLTEVTPGGGPYREWPAAAVLPWRITGAGGIRTVAVVGKPALTWVRTRAARDRELLLMATSRALH